MTKENGKNTSDEEGDVPKGDNSSDDIQIIPDHVADVLNELFGEDIDNLKNVDKILENLTSKEIALEKAIKESQKQTCENLEVIVNSCETMLNEIKMINGQASKISIQHSSHREKCEKMESEMKELRNKVETIENEQVYMMWVREIQSLDREVESHIQKKNVSNAITSYNKLHVFWSELEQTTCSHLKLFANDICRKLFDTLKDILFKDLNSLLTSMKYPFSTGISSPHFSEKEKTEDQFKKNLSMLALLKPLQSTTSEHSLIIELLTEPLKKRFSFHFYGERHTNNPEKPEWYFMQVINWIKDHSPFLEDYVVPILNPSQENKVNLKQDFFQSLVSLVEEKLHCTIDAVRSSDIMIAHLIDETILFEKALKECIGDSCSSFGCLHILLREDFFDLWLRLEEKFTREFMHSKLDDQEAWVPKFSDLTTKDKNLIYYAPKCVEEFVSFVTMMNKRHQTLKNKIAEQKFLSMLVVSLENFVSRISDLSCGPVMAPLSQNYYSVVNGACYILHVLEEWSEDVYLVQLLDGDVDAVSSKDEQFPYLASSKVEIQDVEEESIFQRVLDSLKSLITTCVDRIVDTLKGGMKSKLPSYRSESWQALPSIKDYIKPSLSSGACDMMLYIKDRLHILEEKLCPDVFEKVWKKLTSMIDYLIFHEIVFQSHFNEGGASQLQFDMKENLFALFGQYTNRPESYFRLLKDSCILLNLPTGTAYLLKEVIQQTKNKDHEQTISASLKDVGVSHLSLSQANRLINSRIDYWPVLS